MNNSSSILKSSNNNIFKSVIVLTGYFEYRVSHKAFSFRLDSLVNSNEVHLFESAIDLLSYATLNSDYDEKNLLSLAGIYQPKNNLEERIKWGKYYIETVRKNEMSCVIWDNGIFKKEVDAVGSFYGLYHREELTWQTDELVDTYIKAAELN